MTSPRNRIDKDTGKEPYLSRLWHELGKSFGEILGNQASASPVRFASERELDKNYHIPVIKSETPDQDWLGTDLAGQTWLNQIDRILQRTCDCSDVISGQFGMGLTHIDRSVRPFSQRDLLVNWSEKKASFEAKVEEIAQNLKRPSREFLEPFWEVESRDGSRRLFVYSSGTYEVIEPKYYSVFYYHDQDSESVVLVGLSFRNAHRLYGRAPRIDLETFLDSTFLLLMMFILWRSSKSKESGVVAECLVSPIALGVIGCGLEKAIEGESHGRNPNGYRRRTGQRNGQNRPQEIERAEEGRGREERLCLVSSFWPSYGG